MSDSMERQYLKLAAHIIENGAQRGDRTGTGTKSIFGAQIRCDLREGFPLLTTKKMFMKGIVHELLWFLAGRTDVAYLQERGVKIWDEWATPEQCAKYGRAPGDLGPVYGKQWRNFGGKSPEDTGNIVQGFDQISWLVKEIEKNPNSRRLVVSAWDPHDAQVVALPPCHTLFQCCVQDGALSLHLYMRSADLFLGVPFNIASYACLTHLLALATGNRVGDLIVSFGDVHIYNNHFSQFAEQLSREPFDPPQLLVKTRGTFGIGAIDDARYEDFVLTNYKHHDPIKGEVSV